MMNGGEREPTATRVPQADGSSMSLKMSIGKEKKLHATKDITRLMYPYADFAIKGFLTSVDIS
jgi:hypothetical protein